MADLIYSSYLGDLLSGNINLASDPIYVALISGSYSPSTGHSLYSQVSTHESVGAGYTKGGQLLTSKTVTIAGSQSIFDAADVSWTSSTITASGAVVWYSGGASASQQKLISYTDLGNSSSTNGLFRIEWSNSDGIFKINVT